MVRLVCSCLNVKIHAKSVGVPADPCLIGLEKKENEEFFGLELNEVVLNLEGIHVEHMYLINKHVCNSWIVHRCNNCRSLTHAIHTNPDVERVLVSPNLLSDELAIERLSLSLDFSDVFKIIVKSRQEPMPVVIDWIPKEVRDVLQTIQQQVNSFLISEEKEMEDRITEFETEEKAKYAKQQSKAKNDKNVIMRTVLTDACKDVSDSLLEAMKESPVGNVFLGSSPPPPPPPPPLTSEAIDEMTSNSPLTFGALTNTDVDIPSVAALDQRRLVSRSESTKSKKSETQASDDVIRREITENSAAPVTIGDDDDDVFKYDPTLEEDPKSQPFSRSRPFSESEEEEEESGDDDDSEGEEATITERSPKDSSANYSKSMPISVPGWKPQVSRNEVDEIVWDPADPESIAASMKALTRSIKGDDGSEIFGELPTSRNRIVSLRSGCQYH